MPKSRAPSDKTVERWITEGLGQGSGPSYRPFMYVRDVPSRGRSTIVEGLKIQRIHHYFSDIEYEYHLLSEFSDAVTEIREQFALLPKEETFEIARELGVRHPAYSTTGALRVQTSDLVLTLQKHDESSLNVLCCKMASDIDPKNPSAARTLEKILIEKIYWRRRNVAWHLVTDKMIPKIKVKNLDFFRVSMVAKELDFLNKSMPEFLHFFHENWNPQHSLNHLLHAISNDLGIEIDHSFCLLGRAIWTKLLVFDLNSSLITHENPLPKLLIGRLDD